MPQQQYGGVQPGQAMQPGAPQAPAAPPQQGSGLPQIGFGGLGPGGMPRINVGGGAFAPQKLMAAVVSGQGFEGPRKMGAMMMAVCIAFVAANTALVLVLHRYYPYLYSLGAIFGWTGLWLVVTGQPRVQPDGSKAPIWSRIGLAASFGIGVLAGIALTVLNWETAVFRSL
jgi:hypothetical protein